MKIPPFIVEVRPAEMIPRGYGIMTMRWESSNARCCWLPFNLPIRMTLALLTWLRHPLRFFDAAHAYRHMDREVHRLRRKIADLEYELDFTRRR